MALRSRQPTGQVAYPIVLVEGAEKVGKTYAAFSLSASEHVGRTFVFDVGEGCADEYAALGPYEVIDHDGTFTDFIDQIEAATQEPSVDGKPNVIVIDSGTVLWEGLKDWAAKRARNSKANRRLLASDPDAEINVSSTYWNDANDRWGRMLRLLRGWPGISVVICRGKEIARMGADGNPIPGQTDYKIEAQKAFGYNANVHVRIEAPGKAKLTAVRSLSVEVPSAGIPLEADNPIAHALFGVIGAGRWQVAPQTEPQFGRTATDVKLELVARFTDAGMSDADAKQAASALWATGPCPSLSKADEVSDADYEALMTRAVVSGTEADDDISDAELFADEIAAGGDA